MPIDRKMTLVIIFRRHLDLGTMAGDDAGIPPWDNDCDDCATLRAELPNNDAFCESCDGGCLRCGCRWVFVRDELLQHADDTWGDDINFPDGRNPGATVSTRQVRFALYQHYVFLVYGHLGPGIRKDPPKCVKEAIYDEFPNPDGVARVGFTRE